MDAWSVAFSPDSKHIATGSHLGKVNIFGVESGKKEFSLDTRGKFILSIAYVRNITIKKNVKDLTSKNLRVQTATDVCKNQISFLIFSAIYAVDVYFKTPAKH